MLKLRWVRPLPAKRSYCKRRRFSRVPTRSTNNPSGVPLLDMRALERGKLAAAQGAAQKHRQNRPVPLSPHGFELGLSEVVARLKGVHQSGDWAGNLPGNRARFPAYERPYHI